MICHAARRNSGGDTAVYPSVEWISDYQTRGWIYAAGAGNVVGGIEIPGQIIFFGIGSEKAHAQSDVQCQARCRVPIILNEWFEDVVLLVHLKRRLLLGEGTYISQKHVGKCIPRRDRTAVTKLQEAIHSIAGLRNFIFVRQYRVYAELQIMRTDNLGDVVAERKRWIGVQRAVRNVPRVFGEVILTTSQGNAGHLSTKAVIVDSDRWEIWGRCHGPIKLVVMWSVV